MMKRSFLSLLLLLVLVFPISSLAIQVSAVSTIFYADNFNVYFATNEILSFQDSYLPYLLYLNVTSGNFNATSCKVIIYDNEQGSFWFTVQESCIITVTSSVSNTRLYLDNFLWNGIKSLVAGRGYYVKWFFPSAPKTSVLLIHSSIYGTSDPIAGTYDYLVGTKLNILATPISEDYSFGYWVVNGVNKTFNPLSLILTTDTELTPVYKVENSSGVYYLLGDLFPNLIVESSTGKSGEVENYGTDYAEVQAEFVGTNIFSREDGFSFINVGQSFFAGGLDIYSVSRGLLYFDTSNVLPGTEIINATLYLYVPSNQQLLHDNDFSLVVQNGQPLRPSIPANVTDYDRQLYGGNFGSIKQGDLTLDSYNAIALNISILNLGGLTKMCLRTDNDINGVYLTSLPNNATHDETIVIRNQYWVEDGRPMNYCPLLRLWTSTDAQITISVNIEDAPIFVNGLFIGYGNFSYGVQPNNKTSNPHYTVSFGAMQGYITPKPVTVTLGYGGIGIVTGIYRAINPPSSFGWPVFSFVASSIFVPGLIIGIISSGFYIAGKKLDHAWGAALLGAALSLALMGWFQVVPIWVVGMIFAIGGFLMYYLWWKRGSNGN